MWERGWRDRLWSELKRPWDLIVIGGGITGAGILREATRAGLRTLLLEARDFASGTSSRSSKLVHGGLRYLKHGEIRLTLESVRERERLLREGKGLIEQLGFLLPSFAGDVPPGWLLGLGLTIYDVLALKWGHRHYAAAGLRALCPPLRAAGLLGGYRYFDATTDDARLVLRVMREAVRAGGTALNYARVEGLLRSRSGEVCGVSLRDEADPGGRAAEPQAPVVINATGAWADELRAHVGAGPRLRRLRGSHLVFAAHRLPLRRAVSFLHPWDRRPVFALPWEGVTVLGTTDVDHRPPLDAEPRISALETEYLLAAVAHAFPSLGPAAGDVQATFAGVRPVVDTGKAHPSDESREHVLWVEQGLLTVTGGKLTTFRRMAHHALRAVRRRWYARPTFDARQRMLEAPPLAALEGVNLQPGECLRLAGRYGLEAEALVAAAGANELASIGGSPALWAELRWAARAEGIVHLDDLLLRRVRLGLLLPRGGVDHLPAVRAIVQPELGWTDERWQAEADAYVRRWRNYHAPPLGTVQSFATDYSPGA